MRCLLLFVLAAQAPLGQCLNVARTESTGTEGSESAAAPVEDNFSASVAASVNLTDEGFDTIVALHDEQEMAFFIGRLLTNGARIVRDPAGLKTLAKRYSLGGSQSKDLDVLRAELGHAWWVGEGQGKTAMLNQKGFEAVAAQKSGVQMRAFLRRVVKSMGLEVKSNFMIDVLAEELAGVNVQNPFRDLQNLLKRPRFTRKGQPALAIDMPITEDDAAGGTASYISLALVNAILEEESNETEGSEGAVAEDNFSASVAASVNLTDEGFDTIVALHDEEEMAFFIGRLLTNGARIVRDPAALKSFAKRYSSGGSQAKDLNVLRTELGHARWIGEGQGKTAKLNNKGFEAVAALKSGVQMRAFLRRVVTAMGLEVKSNFMIDVLAEELAGVNEQNPFRDLQNLLKHPRFTRKGQPALAVDMPLTEDGYLRLATQRDDEQMKIFVKRILASEGRSVTDEAGLSGFVPYYSGTVATSHLYSLKAELREPRHAKWIDPGFGRKAPLTEDGYNSVAASKDPKQMKAFIRRLATRRGHMMISEGALSGMVPFFSGEVMTQPFSELKKSLSQAKAELSN